MSAISPTLRKAVLHHLAAYATQAATDPRNCAKFKDSFLQVGKELEEQAVAIKNTDEKSHFCHYQIWDCENNGWACTAHLNEGRVFKCHKKSMKDAKRVPVCEDARPPEEERQAKPPEEREYHIERCLMCTHMFKLWVQEPCNRCARQNNGTRDYYQRKNEKAG